MSLNKGLSEGDETKRHMVLAGKRKIAGVNDVTNEEYNKIEDRLRSQWRLRHVSFYMKRRLPTHAMIIMKGRL